MTSGSTALTTAAAVPQTVDKPKRRGLHRAFWIVSLIILLFDGIFIAVNFNNSQAVMRETLNAEGAQQEMMFDLDLRNQGLHMQQFATYLANQPQVRELFLAGREAVEREGGGPGSEAAARIRTDLYELISPGWQQVTGRYKVRQLHFHLGPGDISFLRVHKPSKFGDDLSSIRHTITHAIDSGEPTYGFESGRVIAGIRGVVPIRVERANGERQVVGALEAGSSFAEMLRVLESGSGVSYSVLLTGDYFHETHWPDFAAALKRKNPMLDDWYIEGTSDSDAVRKVLRDPAVQQALGQRQAVITEVTGVPLAVYSFPFRDYLRTVSPELPPIGVVLAWQDATSTLAAADASLRTNLMVGVLGFIIVETLLFVAWTLARSQLQRVIDHQVTELSDINHDLQKEIALRMQSEHRLRDYQAGLESLVDERTRSLSHTVDALQTEMAQRQEIERQLQRERDQARVTLRSIADGVITTDVDGRVRYLNPAAEHLTGWPLEEAKNRPICEVFRARDLEDNGHRLGYEKCLRGQCERQHGENTELRRRAGDIIVVEHSVSPILDEAGKTSGLVLVFHDDTEARELASQLSYQATHDALTGLVNRRAIEIELGESLRVGRNEGKRHAFLYIDLDQFKIVNDTCGHVAGDELLRQVAKLLQQRTRQSDCLARLGGDEFGLLLRDCPADKASDIGEDLLDAINAFRFVWSDRSFKIGASIGIALIDREVDSIETVLSMADSACYLAKDKGRSRVQLSSPDNRELLLRRGEMDWVSRIHDALGDDRLVLYGQPIVPVRSRAGVQPHQEILVRMLDRNGDLIAPNAFIPAAERYGMMHDVDRWIIDRSFRFIAESKRLWPEEARGIYGINLSGETMAHETILPYIKERLAHYAIDPAQVCFEITETAAIANLPRAIDLMGSLKADGCLFALDDFGSGLSSFGYLKALPVDFLKIDGAFVKNLDSEPVNRVMVQAINMVGHAMHLQTIAEFVENDAIMETLALIGVDYAQGFGIARPAALT
jgi:diguanylate cyclase (GGDEF)-like protein/PAS domain S-box-containing protein